MAKLIQYGRVTILVGNGKNCTCSDCPVLYGGECPTTEDNNFLDQLELEVVKYLTYTPKGKLKKVSSSYIDKCIEEVLRVPICKKLKVTRSEFYNQYYSFVPLLFIMTSSHKAADYWYRRTRLWTYYDAIKGLEK